MRLVKVAATQMTCTKDVSENIGKAERMVRQAAEEGAQIILLQELFETPYFCQTEHDEFYDLATEVEDNKAILHFKKIA
jgi:N-carbamoylputrescine amidase